MTSETSGLQCYEKVKADKSQQEDGAHKKDRLETYLHAQLCKNPSAELLEEYQSKIKFDWISFYHEVYADEYSSLGRAEWLTGRTLGSLPAHS